MGGVSCCSAAEGLPCCTGKECLAENAPGNAEPLGGQEAWEVRGMDTKMSAAPGFGVSSKANDLAPDSWRGLSGTAGAGASLSSGCAPRREDDGSSPAGEPIFSWASPQQMAIAPPEERALSNETATSSQGQLITFTDGSTYRGQVHDGKRSGHGIWQSKEWTYDGHWKADEIHGHGKQRWADGRMFEGQFCDGKFSGFGRMHWPSGAYYEGEYKDDLKHGRGKFVWADNRRTLDCEWLCGQRHGRGVYTNSKGDVKTGFWGEDQFLRWEGRSSQSDGSPEFSTSMSPPGLL
mmetsp:Transcript_54732/g.138686  ORF Transcript_54732/g.138686 Transcript_54732/m.138686 type:complete len:292 (-) Transcript_54732:120-995(-)